MVEGVTTTGRGAMTFGVGMTAEREREEGVGRADGESIEMVGAGMNVGR